MRKLVIYRHYWPDTAPYSKLIQCMAEHWAESGEDVTVYSGQPGYNDIFHMKRPSHETYHGVKIRRISLFPEKKKRLWIRIVNFFLFSFHSFWYVFTHKKFDLVFINSYPPIIMGFTARMIYKFLGIPYIYHCQDLHPESAMIAGQVKNRHFFNCLMKLDTDNCKMARLVVTLSQDMSNTLVLRGISADKIRIVNNFILNLQRGTPNNLPSKLTKQSNEEFRILFAGNMGNFQGLDCIVEAAKMLGHNKLIKFVFMGEGSAKSDLMRLSGRYLDDTIFFVPHQPLEVAFYAMGISNIGIISLKPDVYKVAFPSKTMMYLAAGCPLFAVVEKESILARDIVRLGLGYICSERNPRRIAQTLNHAFTEKKLLGARKAHITKMAYDMFDRDVTLDRWADILAEF